MVGIDALSQQTAAVKQLSDHHELPVCAIHSPCLLFTQRVWGTDPWGKLERSAEMAHAVGADVVVVHPPFRWQKEYAAGFVDGIAALEESTGLAFAVENMYPWRASARRGVEMYLPGWDPSDENYRNATIDLSHAAIAQSSPVEMAKRLGDRLRHVHLTDGSGSAKDEHLVPGRGAMDAAGFLGHLAREGFDGHIVLEINTRKARTREEREADLRASLEFAREHFVGALDVSAERGPPRTSAGGARHPGRDPGRGSHVVRRQGFRRYDDPRHRRGRRGRRAPSSTTTSAPRTTCSWPPSSCRSTRARRSPRHSSSGPDGAGERVLRVFVGVWDDPANTPASGPGADAARPVGEPPAPRGLPAGGARSRRAGAGPRPPRAADATGREPDLIGMILGRYVLRLEPVASMPADAVVATYAPDDPALPHRRPPLTPRGPSVAAETAQVRRWASPDRLGELTEDRSRANNSTYDE